jgi:hypothetical protein
VDRLRRFEGLPPPIRLKVSYKSPASLLSEFTRSVGRATVSLESRTAVPLGTRFVFELVTPGLGQPVEVHGEVVQVTPAAQGRFHLQIRYEPGAERLGLDAIVQRIFSAQQFEKKRQHARIPIQVVATEETPYSPSYVVRDISMGGLGVEVDAAKLPAHARLGNAFLCELWLSTGALGLYGEVVWVSAPQAEGVQPVRPSFGVRFGKLRQSTVERLEKILHLHGLPPPPWRARVSFGLDAVSRMP